MTTNTVKTVATHKFNMGITSTTYMMDTINIKMKLEK